MTDTNIYIKWFYRCLLIALVSLMSYVVFQPSYNFAHWVPHDFLRNLGIPYAAVLNFESNADKILHPLGAAIVTTLLICAKIPLLSSSFAALLTVIMGITLTEIGQAIIGRGFDVVDLCLGVIGSLISFLLHNHQKPIHNKLL